VDNTRGYASVSHGRVSRQWSNYNLAGYSINIGLMKGMTERMPLQRYTS